MILYILGNGFDIFHGLASKWRDFFHFLLVHEGEAAEELPLYEFFPVDTEYWHRLSSDFWELLHELGTKEDIPEISDHFGWIYPVQEGKDYDPVGLEFRLGSTFQKWAFRLSRQPVPPRKRFRLKQDAWFISFNATDLPERLYGIDSQRIDYINGKVMEKSAVPTDFSRVASLKGWSNADEKLSLALVREKRDFATVYARIQQVAVIGHSFPDHDIPFFRELVQQLPRDCKWTITVYEQADIDRLKELPALLGIPSTSLRGIDCNPERIEQNELFHPENE